MKMPGVNDISLILVILEDLGSDVAELASTLRSYTHSTRPEFLERLAQALDTIADGCSEVKRLRKELTP